MKFEGQVVVITGAAHATAEKKQGAQLMIWI